jgi:acetate kinase
MGKGGLSMMEANTLLNKHSGLIGLSGDSSDMREIEEAMQEGDKRSKRAFDVFTYRIKKYLGAYAAAMGGVDAFVFTGGIGENSPLVRRDVCENMNFLGIELDADKNETAKGESIISNHNSKVKVFRIPTNEELVIALDTEEIVKEQVEEGKVTV